MKPRQRFT